MDEAIEDLVLAPFRDIVAQATAALHNAGGDDEDSGTMREAAHALLREGERALRRIEPLCWRKVEEFGLAFVDGLKDDADISKLIEQLNDLLYDFEEFIEVGSFDGEKFAGLQALSRKAAPVIAHRITRMKLDNHHGHEGEEVASSPASSGPPTVLIRETSNEVGSAQQFGEESLAFPEADAEGGRGRVGSQREYTGIRPWPSPAQDPAAKQQITTPPPASFPLPTVQEEELSPPRTTPALDTWSECFRDIEHGLELVSRQHGALSTTYADSAIGSEANSEHTCHSPVLSSSTHSQQLLSSSTHSQQLLSSSTHSQQQQQQQQQTPALPPKSPARFAANLGPTSERTASFVRAHQGRDGSISPVSPRLPQQRDSGATVSLLSTSSSVRVINDGRERGEDSYFEVMSPLSPTTQEASSSSISPSSEASLQHEAGRPQSAFVRPLFASQEAAGGDEAASSFDAGTTPASSVAGVDSGPSPAAASLRMAEALKKHDGDDTGMQPVTLPSPALIPDGLMLVEEKEVCEPRLGQMGMDAQLGCCELGMGSSYYRFKECAGAMEILQGGLGVKYVRKQRISDGNIEVAKCKACAYELEWKAVQRDINNEATENFKSEGIGFRLRFLSKSHMHAKNIGEQTYNCLFCVQQRRMTHPNDATVFFSQRQLFAHLARHPRPLPAVPGVTVIEQNTSQQPQIPPQFANNYDLLFTDPPRPSPIVHHMRALTALPTATAVQTCRPSRTGRGPGAVDGTMLAVAVGARILGVEFPERFQGEWCVGWADHEHGLMETDALRFIAPPKDVIRHQGASSAMRAMTRWKSAGGAAGTKDGCEWLAFGKGEVITNIGWPHQEHWCWWGTNARGKSGLFLRSHVEAGTLMVDGSRPGGGSVKSVERRRSGLLSRISMRRQSSGSGGAGARVGSSSSQASIN